MDHQITIMNLILQTNENNMYQLEKEIDFHTARSGGKGGQNVNKVETAVTGSWKVTGSALFTDHQKEIILEKLQNRINAEGELRVKSQAHRSQLSNKEEVVLKMHQLITDALKKKKIRIATKPGKKVKENRIQAKKKNAEVKNLRKRLKPGDY